MDEKPLLAITMYVSVTGSGLCVVRLVRFKHQQINTVVENETLMCN